MKLLRVLAGLRASAAPELVADASVAVKWFVEEKDSELAERLKAAAGLIAPDWIVAECAQTFWKRAGRGDILEEQADFAIRNLSRWFVRLEPVAALAPRALEIARELNHSAYDCVYLALAERERTKVVTADRRFLKAAQQGGWGDLIVSLRDAVE